MVCVGRSYFWGSNQSLVALLSSCVGFLVDWFFRLILVLMPRDVVDESLAEMIPSKKLSSIDALLLFLRAMPLVFSR